MRKFYVEIGVHKYDDYTSYTETLGHIVVYAAGDGEAYELATTLHPGLVVNWPTEEEPK